MSRIRAQDGLDIPKAIVFDNGEKKKIESLEGCPSSVPMRDWSISSREITTSE